MKPIACVTTAFLLATTPSAAHALDRVLRAEVLVPAPPESVWAAWTTPGGVATFFAPAARIEPRVDGSYDILFEPGNPPGQQGAEGMRIVAFEPLERLAFTWNAPPSIPAIRAQRTLVEIALEPAPGGATRLRFTQSGWGRGADWDRAYDYFDQAWGAVVLPRMVHRFTHGPLDWVGDPEVKPLGSMQVTLEPSRPRGR